MLTTDSLLGGGIKGESIKHHMREVGTDEYNMAFDVLLRHVLDTGLGTKQKKKDQSLSSFTM